MDTTRKVRDWVLFSEPVGQVNLNRCKSQKTSGGGANDEVRSRGEEAEIGRGRTDVVFQKRVGGGGGSKTDARGVAKKEPWGFQ